MKSGAWTFLNAASVVVLALTSATTISQAAPLVIGVQTETTSVDPHNYVGGGDNQIRMHLFDAIVAMNASQKIEPALAESWTLANGVTWTFKLRQGVTFHDGAPFTANDFIYTICRIRNFKEATGSFSRYTGAIKTIDAPDEGTVVVTTTAPYPALLNELSALAVISAKAAGQTQKIAFDDKTCGIDKWPDAPSFNSGKMAIGTGPYKYVAFAPSTHLRMARNDRYWAGPPTWDAVTIRPIPNSAARLASLLAGDVDLIDSPPPQDMERLHNSSQVSVTSGPSQTLIYLQFQHANEPAVGISGTDGKNPFRDIRVRQAVSKAIDRRSIIDRILQGQAQIATNVMGPDYDGYNPDIKAETFDLEGARKLMSEAGYAKGFGLVMGATNDRYSGDARIAQAVAQMLTRIGIKVELEVTPYAVFLKKWQNSELPFFQTGLAVSSVDMAQTLRALVGTKGKAPGFGVVNYGNYTNDKLDSFILEAVTEVNDAKRAALLREANMVASTSYAIIPFLHPMNIWAHNKKVTLIARNDNATLAMSALPSK